MFKQNTRFEILTPDGFKSFDGINKVTHETALKIHFSNGAHLQCSEDHPLVSWNGLTTANRLKLGDLFKIDDNFIEVTQIQIIDTPDEYYDPINVDGGHLYISNGVVSHNCEFISNEALLIDANWIHAATTTVKDRPVLFTEQEFDFWENIIPRSIYIVGVDPATGSGSDFSVINVFHFPSLRQVAQFRSNTTSTSELYKYLKWMLKYLTAKGASEINYSVENNGVGEGVIALAQNDETHPANAEFISEEGRKRKGFTTTAKAKMKACVNLKQMLEKHSMTVSSEILLKEVKTFVRHSGSYVAQYGSTDDCISSLLVITRIIEQMSKYDEEAFDVMYNYGADLGDDTAGYIGPGDEPSEDGENFPLPMIL